MLTAIRQFLELCKEFVFKLQPAKYFLYSKTIRLCGQIVLSDGIQCEPRHIDGLKQNQSADNGAQSKNFVCDMQWLRNSSRVFQRKSDRFLNFSKRLTYPLLRTLRDQSPMTSCRTSDVRTPNGLVPQPGDVIGTPRGPVSSELLHAALSLHRWSDVLGQGL